MGAGQQRRAPVGGPVGADALNREAATERAEKAVGRFETALGAGEVADLKVVEAELFEGVGGGPAVPCDSGLGGGGIGETCACPG